MTVISMAEIVVARAQISSIVRIVHVLGRAAEMLLARRRTTQLRDIADGAHVVAVDVKTNHLQRRGEEQRA